MKTETHTPGPWETSPDAVPEWHVQTTIYAEDGGERVATAFLSEANARLIAAAPDLLAALIAARPLIDVTHPRAAKVHRVVLDALSKAMEAGS